MRWFILFLPCVHAVVTSNAAEWSNLILHPTQSREYLTDTDLVVVINDVWNEIRSECPNIPANPNIYSYFDTSLENTFTLAWASQTLVLNSDFTWWSALIRPSYSGYDFTIGVNPNPPNGWFTGECSRIGYRYDLRTVLRHEILHGIGLSSSIRMNSWSAVSSTSEAIVEANGDTWKVGHEYANRCFPRYYDTKITDSNGDYIVSECNIGEITGKDIFLGDVKLYNPPIYKAGSSISHHNYFGHLMYYALPSKKCLHIGKYEINMLNAVGIECFIDEVSSATKARYILLHLVLLMFLLFLTT